MLVSCVHPFEAASEIQQYVRPVVNPVLTPFIQRLTAIEQPTVDAAPTFPDALAAFNASASGRILHWEPFSLAHLLTHVYTRSHLLT